MEASRPATTREPAPVSVIITVLNEARTMRPLLDSLLHQAVAPAEIVVADAGSTDGTADIVRAYADQGVPVRLLLVPGANRAQGRNAAVRAATYDLIACTDAGCQMSPQWLGEIIGPMLVDPEVVGVAGHTHADANSLFEAVSAALFYADPPRLDHWLPSSRSVAFRRSAWQAVGGYPENMRWNEDTPFDLALRKLGAPLAVAPYAIVHWRPRQSMAALFQQFFNYARGDGQGRIFPVHYGRKALWYGSGLVLLWGGSRLWPLWVLLVLAMSVFLARRLRPVWRLVPSRAGLLQGPAQIIAVDIASILGYVVGLIEGAPPGRSAGAP